MRREFIIDGNNFDDIQGFYCEVDRILTKNLTWRAGHNLDAFNDLLRGGFGVHEYGEQILLKWLNFNKSKQDLGYEATIKHYERMLETCHPTNKNHAKKAFRRCKASHRSNINGYNY